ncbi:MAG TPA: EAL domain-containing protein [Sphingobium sp.]|nr:EAL domain-containing protein [Sphingobium sp.]
MFQSRHALHDGSVVGYDTLLRIPGVDAIGPWFAARDHDTAFDLTLAAARAASDLSRHLPDGRQNAIVAFHCPPAIFCDARFLREMTLLAQTAGHVRDSIAIGLATPTGNLRFNDLRDIAFRYVLAGFRLHLTDFTLETDNLQQMTCLPLSEAKLDCRVFLHELRMNDPLLLPEILSLLRLRGIRSTIAQIETAENVELARRAGADCGQGRYWSHPIQPLHASS